MNNPKISVIIPIYNAGKYVASCLDSLLSQTFTDFEILLIDDGSNDNSGDICDEYATKDSRIRVFHKENGGVSSARNLGLDHVCGEWVVFVDADDEVTDGYLNICTQFEDADVIQKPYVIIGDDKVEYMHRLNVSVLNKRDDIFRYYVQKRNNALWDKLIKRELIGNMRFNTNVSIGEDFLFFLSLLPKVKTWAFDNDGIYRYYIRKGSAMQSIDLIKRIRILFENIIHVQSLTNSKELIPLQKSIVYDSYVWLLHQYKCKLNYNQKERLKALFNQMNLGDLKYIRLKKKLKLLFYKINYMCVCD